ncbi:MAG: hypothetical protein QOI46_6091 [Alphaproteobacteria bacterium]|nr:hypothetical protein [Alphaproteobacteria bacterium]
MFLYRGRFNDSNCVRRGKGFFEPEFHQPLKMARSTSWALPRSILCPAGLVFVRSLDQLALRARAFNRFAGVRWLGMAARRG